MGVMIFIVGVIIKDCFTLYNIMTVYGMEDYNMYAFFTDIGTMFSNFTMYVFPLMIFVVTPNFIDDVTPYNPNSNLVDVNIFWAT